LIIYSPSRIDRFTCVYRECRAKCCTPGRVITARGRERIARATGMQAEEFIEGEAGRGLFRLKGKNGRCIFLQENYECLLHNLGAKPLSCQMYPFLLDGVVYGDEIFLRLVIAKECPGIGRGESLGEEFELKIEALGNKFVREIEEYLREVENESE